MKRIGLPLEWDLSHDDYDFDDNRVLTLEQCEVVRGRLHKMAKASILNNI